MVRLNLNGVIGNWDLEMLRNSIALFPLKDKGTYDSVYRGNEYMEIYPHIVY